MDWIYRNIFDPEKVTRASCEQVDCLHPCFGASHEAYCGKCWESVYSAIKASTLEDMQDELREECSAC